MPPLMRLPGYEVPQNALMNYAPINQGLSSIRQQNEQDRQYGLQQEQLGMQRERFGMEKQRFASEERRRIIDQVGNLAAAADGATDPRQRSILLKRALELHPDYASGKLDPAYMDPVNGPKILSAEAGKARDALAEEERKLSIAGKRQALAQGAQEGPLRLDLLRAQTSQANQRDELGQAKAAILRGMLPGLGVNQGGAPAQGGQPRLQPQSYGGAETGVPGTVADDPNFVRTQAAGPAPSAPAPGMLDNLTPGQRAGVALGMIGMGDAGKIIADADPRKLGNEARNELDKKQLNTTESLARLNQISQSYRPEFQQIEPRLGFAWTDLVSKFRAGRVSPEQQRQLAEFSAFRADAINNLNQYIKEITGAAMTNAEAERLTKALPNPGSGIFDGDSPPDFEAKLKAGIRNARLAIARYNFMRANGFTGNVEEAAKSVPLERMNKIINDRAGAILRETQNANPGIAPDQLRPLVRQRLRSEFGIDA